MMREKRTTLENNIQNDITPFRHSIKDSFIHFLQKRFENNLCSVNIQSYLDGDKTIMDLAYELQITYSNNLDSQHLLNALIHLNSDPVDIDADIEMRIPLLSSLNIRLVQLDAEIKEYSFRDLEVPEPLQANYDSYFECIQMLSLKEQKNGQMLDQLTD